MTKVLKKSASVILIFALVLSLSACGEIKKAESSVLGMLDELKALNFEEASKYTEKFDEIISSEDFESEEVMIFAENIFDDMEYQILESEKIDSSNVNVKVSITAVDMKPVMEEYFKNVMGFALSSATEIMQMTEEEITQKATEMLVEVVSKPDLATVTNEVTIKVTKTEAGWMVDVDDAFVNALLGGLEQAAQDLANSFNAE